MEPWIKRRKENFDEQFAISSPKKIIATGELVRFIIGPNQVHFRKFQSLMDDGSDQINFGTDRSKRSGTNLDTIEEKIEVRSPNSAH